MTFTTQLKEEISKQSDNEIEKRIILISFFNVAAIYNNNAITINSETASVIRRIYSDIKSVFLINPRIKVRIQKRFKIKQIYSLEINEKMTYLKDELNIKELNHICNSPEEFVAFLKGAFLAGGSITDPKNSGYHMEFNVGKKVVADTINKILNLLKIHSKILRRNNKYVVYIKAAEEISDLLKMFKAVNSLFYFEDIRIYRDHKNTVNRLTNCEIANQEKTTKTGMDQIDLIMFLEKNNLVNLLDDKAKTVIEYRKLYPEYSYLELSDIISSETEYKIGKSGINHNFIKIKELVRKYKEGKKNE